MGLAWGMKIQAKHSQYRIKHCTVSLACSLMWRCVGTVRLTTCDERPLASGIAFFCLTLCLENTALAMIDARC